MEVAIVDVPNNHTSDTMLGKVFLGLLNQLRQSRHSTQTSVSHALLSGTIAIVLQSADLRAFHKWSESFSFFGVMNPVLPCFSEISCAIFEVLWISWGDPWKLKKILSTSVYFRPANPPLLIAPRTLFSHLAVGRMEGRPHGWETPCSGSR